MDRFQKPPLQEVKKPPTPVVMPTGNEAILSLLTLVIQELRILKAQNDEILGCVTNTEDRVMALPAEITAVIETVKTGIRAEIEEGMKFKALSEQATAKVAELEALLANTPTPGAGQAILDLKEVVDAIATINPTPVSDALVTEVISNDAITTPEVVEAAPEVAPEVIQTEEVVVEAIDAIVAPAEAVA